MREQSGLGETQSHRRIAKGEVRSADVPSHSIRSGMLGAKCLS